MTKVAEDYRSAPERSSHPLLSPEGSDFSRWWEHEPPRTLAGLGPFSPRESAARALENESDVLDLLGTESEDDENEPTQLLTRSLLQLSPPSISKRSLVLEPSLPAGPELGLPNSDSRLKVALAPTSREEPALSPERAVPAPAPSAAAEPATPLEPLDPSKLDEFARRISHQSVFHGWMANSSPRAAAPSLLVTPKVELPRPRAQTAATLVSAPKASARSLAPLAATLERSVVRLSRSRALVLLSLLGLSRLKGQQASAQQFAAVHAAPLPASPLEKKAAKDEAPPQATKPPAFITLRAGAGAERALVELIGDGHLRTIDSLPARIPANRAETYRVQARSPGYRDFSAELVFSGDEGEKDVLIELTKNEPASPAAPPVARPPVGAAPAPWLQAASPSAAPAAPDDTTGETVVRVKANAKPTAPGSASLNVNSIPISTVIVDGRAQGSTPRVLQVTPGSHTVVFVHPELGRRLVSVEVNSGTTAVAAVRF